MSQPVIIIGAGPVGMTLASELTRFGVGVRIIDKSAARTDKSKALVVWSRTLELLDRGGSTKPFIDAGQRTEAVNIMSGGERIGRVKIEDVDSPYSFGLMLPQSETERLLEERLQSFGVVIERQTELVSFTSRSNGVDAVIRRADGREETVQTEWMVGCDGAHSTVRHGLGIPFTGETMKSDWMLADVHLSGYPFPEREMGVYWHRDGTFVIFPISPGRFRVIADLPFTEGGRTPDPTLEEVQAIIDRRGPGGLKAFDPIWLAGFRINDRKVASYRSGRVFVAGDAAHVHSPAGGQGMNTGMQDAFNLAWKLAMVVQKSCRENVLDSYSAERSMIGDQVLKAAGRLTALATLKNRLAQEARNIAGRLMLGLSFVQHQIGTHLTEVSIGYPESPLNGPSAGGAGPAPGSRLRPRDGELPPGSKEPRFAIFAEHEAAADLVRRFPSLVDAEIRAPLEGHGRGISLVRPDGYVACSAASPDAIAEYLTGIAFAGG